MDVDLLKRTIKYRGFTNEMLAKELGMHRDTLQRRFREQSFRMDEVQKIREILSLSGEDVKNIFIKK